MKRKEFLRNLDERLRVLDFDVKQDIINEFDVHIRQGVETGLSEQEVVRSLGSFEEIVDELLEQEEVKTKFGALYTAFQFGAPPHAGIAPGFDRMLMLLTDSDTIRDVIAFPLNSKAQDLMMGAPSNVKYDQLRDVHIKVDIKEK